MLRVSVSIWLSFVSEPHEEHHDSQSSKEGPLASFTKLRQISNGASEYRAPGALGDVSAPS